MYSILIDEKIEKKAAKGVLAQVKNDQITHKDYKDCLLNQGAMFHEGTKIFQKNHQLYTANIAKKTLSPYNDKKYIYLVDDEYTCYSYGNYNIDLHKFVEGILPL